MMNKRDLLLHQSLSANTLVGVRRQVWDFLREPVAQQIKAMVWTNVRDQVWELRGWSWGRNDWNTETEWGK